MSYARARHCEHLVRLTAYTGCAAALIGGCTTTSLRGGGRYRSGSKSKLQEEFADMLLLIVDEASMVSIAENGRLVDAVRTGKSSGDPLADAAILYLGDFGKSWDVEHSRMLPFRPSALQRYSAHHHQPNFLRWRPSL